MTQFLYEHSSAYQGHLIIPYVYQTIAGHCLYSYRLLSERGYKGKFHKAENPSGLYADKILDLVEIAKEHLNQQVEINVQDDYFQNRYTYKNTLIIIIQQNQKYFYDHYPATELVNIAAPKIFSTEAACIQWIRQGLDRNYLETSDRQ
jgi:hypothetical protein